MVGRRFDGRCSKGTDVIGRTSSFIWLKDIICKILCNNVKSKSVRHSAERMHLLFCNMETREVRKTDCEILGVVILISRGHLAKAAAD